MKGLKWGAAALAAIGLVATIAWVAPVGADPLPEPPAEPSTAHDPAATAYLEALNEGKANDEQVADIDLGLPTGTKVQAFTVETETSGGGPTATGRLSVEYPDPFDPGTSEVIVGIDLVRNVDNQNNFPVISQVTEQSPTGFNVRLLNKEIEGIDEEVVRFQVTAIALP